MVIKFVHLLEEFDNIQSENIKAFIKNKIISISMIEYFVEHDDNYYDYVHLNVDTLCSELKEKQIDYKLVNCELHQANDEIIKYAS